MQRLIRYKRWILLMADTLAAAGRLVDKRFFGIIIIEREER